ncbi:MAG TPA: hypothetical protein VE863_12485 [Pyrinomonadaceae bacterium]|jgi:hypothetical protein|nr:hypothetical protein [Pyrinomonadaceae bacterium]
MKKAIALLIVGLLVGVLGTIFFLGSPRIRGRAGTPLKPPDRNNDSSATVTVAIDEKFFDSLLGTIFNKLGPPQLKLSQNQSQTFFQPAVFQGDCNNTVVVNSESGDVKTSVRFTGGKIIAPLAFSGSYNVLTQCIQFKGTGQATVDLSFDAAKQTVFGTLNVEQLNLEGVNPLVSTLVTAFVRRAIDERLNPFPVLPVSQLSLSVPVHVSGGTLKASVKDVRSEIQEGSLKLYLTYDFSADSAAQSGNPKEN